MLAYLTCKKKILSAVLLLVGLVLFIYAFGATIWGELSYISVRLLNKQYVIDTEATSKSPSISVFGELISKGSPLRLVPVNDDFALVIEKIGLNVPVELGILVTDSDAYNNALRHGVAHALVSDIPSSEPGNVYLFAHSSLNFFSLGKYATAFNLIRKLENGDSVNVFFKGKRFEYSVVNKEIYPGWNTYPLTRKVIEPLLTLQTCDPPGTTLNRLVVTAKLKRVYED